MAVAGHPGHLERRSGPGCRGFSVSESGGAAEWLVVEEVEAAVADEG
jgi:hypothetical protein